jgi:hypothetical protein
MRERERETKRLKVVIYRIGEEVAGDVMGRGRWDWDIEAA